MDLHDAIYWFGFGVLALLGCGGLLCLAYFVFEWGREVVNSYYCELALGSFDLWMTFRQFRKKYLMFGDHCCPHCGGTGLKDSDETTRKELERLMEIARRHDRKWDAAVEKRRRR